MTQSATTGYARNLAEAAFGGDPGCWPLPSASDPAQRWLRAVAAGGQGYYAMARAELRELRRDHPSGRLASLSHSTEGSLARQLGWHTVARGWDGRALLLAGADREARADALIGLAADALGVGRFAASGRLLEQVRGTLADGDGPDRLAIRAQWVSAELAMAVGDGMTALTHAESAVGLAAAQGSERHRTKSAVVLAAALCCAGRIPDARHLADRLIEDTGRQGLVPLRWAVASLLAGIGSEAHPPERVLQIRSAAADLVTRRGGRWSDTQR